ncbi:MAG: hypothetical protein KI791_10000 [Cyclobacteriaceae bacterium]|nr:hypothetical protein [Cyclobacteriaceae bacterium SS2]
MTRLADISLADKGLILFGARPGMGLTRTVLKLANHLAESETVLFISYQTYERKLIKICEELNFQKQDILFFNTRLGFYDMLSDYKTSLNVEISRTNPRTVVIDDLDGLLGENYDLDVSLRADLITGLQELAVDANIRIILNVTLSRKVEHRGGDHRPKLRDFTWCRDLVHVANEVYILYRPEYYGMRQDEHGNNLSGLMEINRVKESNCNEVTYNIACDKEHIIPY